MPRRSPRGAPGRLADSYRSVARGPDAVVRNRVLYSRFIEFGFRPGGGDTFVAGRNPIGRALERQEEAVMEALAKGIDRVAARHGFK